MKIDIDTGMTISTRRRSTEGNICQTGSLRTEVKEFFHCFAGECYYADKAYKDSPELVREAKEAVKEVRRLQLEIKALMTPILRQAEKAVLRAEKAE